MRHFLIIMAMLLAGMGAAAARVLDDTARQIATLKGVTITDTSSEMQIDLPQIRTCNIITLSQATLPMASAMLGRIPDEYGGITAMQDNDMVTVWANDYDDTDGEMLILINCGNGIALVYLDGSIEAMRAGLGM